jgi:hypothetical protein
LLHCPILLLLLLVLFVVVWFVRIQSSFHMRELVPSGCVPCPARKALDMD